MVAQGKPGSIVNVTAVAARQAVEGVPASAYSMAKIGLDTLTTHAAAELAQHGIRVNSGQPGYCGNEDLRALHPRRSVGWCAE
ncbi:SDR family NAD(P)-dependent oxidoreductase [Pseudomonas aeruginosa]|nr:SDR family NAD(P)-dependent oxidoreductase [Pseudomonas aeruginosa]